MSDLTGMLTAAATGDPQAAADLLPAVYAELRKLAAGHLANEPAGHSLDATALVHEAYLRLVPTPDAAFAHRGHFFAAAAEAMRRILIEAARRKKRLKRGGGRKREELHPDLAPTPEPDDRLLALDEALTEFARSHPVHARLVELRYFAGLTGEQAAEVVGVSARTADRHWTFARAWLRRRMAPAQKGENS